MGTGERIDFTAVKEMPISTTIGALIPLKRARSQLSACCPLPASRAGTATAHRIVIRDEAFGAAIEVVVVPSVEGEQLDHECSTPKAAYGYASGLRMVRGWPIVDQAGG